MASGVIFSNRSLASPVLGIDRGLLVFGSAGNLAQDFLGVVPGDAFPKICDRLARTQLDRDDRYIALELFHYPGLCDEGPGIDPVGIDEQDVAIVQVELG